MAREYETLNEALNAVDDEVSAQSDKIEDILAALAGKGSSEGLRKIGTVSTNPQGGTGGYGQLTISRRTGIFLCTNVDITPNNSNRLPHALIFAIDKIQQDKATAVSLTYDGGSTSWTINTTIVGENTVSINGASVSRFLTAATYDVYQLY